MRILHSEGAEDKGKNDRSGPTRTSSIVFFGIDMTESIDLGCIVSDGGRRRRMDARILAPAFLAKNTNSVAHQIDTRIVQKTTVMT